MGSSIAAFKRALLARLKADPAFAGEHMTVSIGQPECATRELVAIGGAARRPPVFVGGSLRANRQYSLSVLVSVVAAHELLENLETRAEEIENAVTTSVLMWKNESAYEGLALDVTPGESSDDDFQKGSIREASVVLSFDVTAIVSYGD